LWWKLSKGKQPPHHFPIRVQLTPQLGIILNCALFLSWGLKKKILFVVTAFLFVLKIEE
jgi:hypothetical protein